MKKYPMAHKVQIVGRRINLDEPTNLTATFARIRKEQAAQAEATNKVVTPIKRATGGKK